MINRMGVGVRKRGGVIMRERREGTMNWYRLLSAKVLIIIYSRKFPPAGILDILGLFLHCTSHNNTKSNTFLNPKKCFPNGLLVIYITRSYPISILNSIID